MFPILLFITIIVFIYYYIWRPLTYWKNRNVPYTLPVPLLGSFYNVILSRASLADTVLRLYNDQPSASIIGLFQFSTPLLMIRDPNILKLITIEKFDHFTDHIEQVFIEKIDPALGKSLFALKGQRWKEMRSLLTPAFTRSKMNNMFNMIERCAIQLVDYCNKEFEKEEAGTLEVEFKDLFTRFATDAIATTAFGFQCNSFQDKENVFFRMGQKLTELKTWKIAVLNLVPKLLLQFLNFHLISDKTMKYFGTLIHENLMKREIEYIQRPDMLNLMLQAEKALNYDALRTQNDKHNRILEKPNHLTGLTNDEVTAQAFNFFFAGLETISTGISFTLYELAVNLQIQKRLQLELESVNGEITYEKIMQLKYLDMIVSETLRKWPPVVVTDRVSTKPYSFELDDLTINIKPGMPISIPVYAIHRNPKFYKCPETYDPERFSNENKSKIYHGSYLPFGVGPRNCIGSRFALMELKIVLYFIFKNFDVVPTKKTTIPLVLKKKSLKLTSKDGFWLGLRKRN